jgi:hypothetical protein
MAPALISAAAAGHENGGDALVVVQNLWGGLGGDSSPDGEQKATEGGTRRGESLPEFAVSSDFAEACVMHLNSRESDVAASAAWALSQAAKSLVRGGEGSIGARCGIGVLRVFCAHAESLAGHRSVREALERAVEKGGVESEGGCAADRAMIGKALSIMGPAVGEK